MNKHLKLIPALLLLTLMNRGHCQLIIENQSASDYNFECKWQSLNNSALVLEFTGDGKYRSYIKGEISLEFEYQETSRGQGLIEIDLIFEDDIENPGKITIQIINKDRIRIFVWKHGDVLDLADEYHRTEDFESMSKHLKKIIKENKKKGSG
jgi:hypothetical protein